MSDPMSSVYENQYGSLADKYATKYGIPTDVFRGVIRDISGFNPYKVNADGSSGIAGLTDGAIKGMDVYNPDSSLDLAARGLASIFNDEAGKSWGRAADIFKLGRDGTGSGDMPDMDAMGNPTGLTIGQSDQISKATTPVVDPNADKPFWKYTSDDWKSFFKKSIFGLLFGIVGVVFILGSIYMLLRQSQSN